MSFLYLQTRKTLHSLIRVSGFCALLFLAACSTASYKPDLLEPATLRARAETQTFDLMSVSAAVPGAEETRAIFGVPLYDKGIQPVWLEIKNNGPNRVRFAPVSLDRDYFSALEVSYMSRKGFSKAARAEMDRRFHGLSMGRNIEPGETQSGFVFTHLSPGTKSFNVDLFGGSDKRNFSFFVDVPGFVPDHANVNFASLYQESEKQDLGETELRAELARLACCSEDAEGQSMGLPINVILIGKGRDILRALLRANWYETPAANMSTQPAQSSFKKQSPYYLYGRKPDAVFRIKRSGDIDRNELRLWLSPLFLDGENVWLGQVTNFVGKRNYIENILFGAHLDPDVDDARGFLLQNMWYSQGLEAFAWSQGQESVSVESPEQDFNDNQYFTDGYRIVLWLSGLPYSLTDARRRYWDELARE